MLCDMIENAKLEKQQLIAQGINKGITQGMNKGIAQGRAEGITQGMAQGINKGIAQGRAEGIHQGELKKALEIAREMLRENLPVNLIMKVTKLSKDQITEIKSMN